MKPIFYFLVALLLSQSTLAATLTVTNGNDAGIGSLRNAITSANAGDNIVFSGVTNVNLTSGALFIDKNLSIDGGASGVTIMRVSVTQFRIFTIQSGSTVSMTKLTITNGNDPGQAGGLQNNGTRNSEPNGSRFGVQYI